MKKEDNEIRLNKYIASSGMCSRRDADEYIKKGLVKVNNKVISELGFKISPNDEVKVNNKIVKPKIKYVYIVMNKPKNTITTTKDESGRNTVIDIIKPKVKERVFPVGRLDRDTTGVLILTNDGELAEKLTHPKYQKRKIYQAILDKNLEKADMIKLVEGVDLEDGVMTCDSVNYASKDDKKDVVVEIHSGKNRIVRRMFEHLGYTVVKLDRVYFAGLTKKGLNRGRWRYLTEHEVLNLKKNRKKK